MNVDTLDARGKDNRPKPELTKQLTFTFKAGEQQQGSQNAVAFLAAIRRKELN